MPLRNRTWAHLYTNKISASEMEYIKMDMFARSTTKYESVVNSSFIHGEQSTIDRKITLFVFIEVALH